MRSAAPELEPTPPRRRRLLLAGGLVVVVLLAVGVWLIRAAQPPALTQADVDAAVQHGIERAQQEQARQPAAASVAFRAIAPSLVTVRAGDSLGSGVVVDNGGSVLTALHVVAGAPDVQVSFSDGTTSAARVAVARPEIDIAVLKADRLPTVVVPAVLAGPPTVGADVYAVGNPLGLQASLSAGVVSATDRTVPAEQGALSGLIQFDAAVNPGNSGGPLLNRAGQVVGIVTGLANPAHEDFFVGIGFAVPIATAGGAAGGPQV